MNWQQKILAIGSLIGKHNISLKMRDTCDWYVSASGLERKEGGCLCGGLTSAEHPEDAVHQFWAWATDPKFYLVVNAMRPERRAVKWNGFMWEDVNEEA